MSHAISLKGIRDEVAISWEVAYGKVDYRRVDASRRKTWGVLRRNQQHFVGNVCDLKG